MTKLFHLVVLFVATFLIGAGFGPLAYGQSMKAGCFLIDGQGHELEEANGTDAHKQVVIASTSKVLTTFWAIKKLGPDFRFQTRVHITPLADNSYDVHIQGGGDPFFGLSQLQFLMSELNSAGVQVIHQLSFDENFKYLTDPRSSPATNGVLESHGWRQGDPSVSLIQSEIVQSLNRSSFSNMSKLNAELAQAQIPARNNLSIKVLRTIPLGQDQFQITPETKSFKMQSNALSVLLKDMNRVSNNYISNVLFDDLGGPQAFESFYQSLGLKDEVDFVNGSGMWIINDRGQKEYNQASCNAVVSTLALLDQILEKKQHDLQDVMAVIGIYEGNECSTMDGDPNRHKCGGVPYNVDPLIGATVAKTGSVAMTTALTGRLSTNQADIYFGYFYAPGSAREAITAQVKDLAKTYSGTKDLNYQPKPFQYFQKDSGFVNITNSLRNS